MLDRDIGFVVILGTEFVAVDVLTMVGLRVVVEIAVLVVNDGAEVVGGRVVVAVAILALVEVVRVIVVVALIVETTEAIVDS